MTYHPAAALNGTAASIYRIEHLVPRTRTVALGEREYQGWVRGPGCKRAIEASYRAAYARYLRAAAAFASSPAGNPSRVEALEALLGILTDLAEQAERDLDAAAAGLLELLPRVRGVADIPASDDPLAWDEFLTEAVLIVVPGLGAAEVEDLGSEGIVGLLRHLRWFRLPDGTLAGDEEPEPQEAGEAANPPATTGT